MFESNIKKENLTENLHKKTGFSLNYSKKLINDLIDVILDNTKNGNLI